MIILAHINRIKTWHGKRWDVVEPYTTEYYKAVDIGKDSNGKEKIKKVLKQVTNEFAVDYQEGKEVVSAIFPFTDDGFKKAKKVQMMFNK